jgi:SPP1 family predicted phage head-tail adaptor
MARQHAGLYRHRITIRSKSVTRNAYGEEIVTPTTFGTYWASVEPIRGREFTEMQQAQAEVTTRIRMRYHDGITPEMDVLFDNDEYQIVAVIPVKERGRELELMCSKRVTY